ncbi:MAG: MmgE/PrpD family protein [Lachnospiraceae bacterium]|nr:MmgE/PrpD family protein [Lachnospiraceae bacterium]
MDIAYDLAAYAANIRYEDLPKSAVEATKRDLFDSLSTGIAGSSAMGIEQLRKVAASHGGNGQASTFVFGDAFPAPVAAGINTTMIHGYDYDDTHDTAMMHSGCIITGCALAAAELKGTVDGRTLITAITAGLDVHVRLSLATTVGIVECGWVYTPLFGIYGGVAAAGRVLGLNQDEMLNAFGIAYGQTAGNYQAITDSAWTKRMQPGFASRAAVEACELAREGVIGAHNVFEGKYGLYKIYLNNRYDREVAIRDLGKVYLHETMALKPWPCGRPSQPPIGCALELKEKYQPDHTRITAVDVWMNAHLLSSGCEPKETRNHPKQVVDGQFSIPYGVACALVDGRVGLKDFTEEAVKREDVLRICALVQGHVDEEIEAHYHAKVCPIRMKVTMEDGTVHEHYMEYTLGCEEKPMTEKGKMEKMEDCIGAAALQIPKERALVIRREVDDLENLTDVGILIRAMIA